jgi:squalene synthase HpnC
MAKSSFAADLQLYGPGVTLPKPLTPRQCRRYCQRLARQHYENFTVASWFLPGDLRQHVCNVYAYCRWADDLADESENPQQATALLRWWEQSLRACCAGQATHPVFVALRETIDRFKIPVEPFIDLLVAFRQDQRVKRYDTMAQVLEYCRYSANPVGRLVLYLGECFDEHRARLADAVCTGLQLANFCQDVARDWDLGRVYLPQVECRRFKYDEAMFARREYNDRFRQLLEWQVNEAAGWLKRGHALVDHLPDTLQLPVALFVHGGLRILEEIRAQAYDVWSKRPTVSRWEKFKLTMRVWWRLGRGTLVLDGEPTEEGPA